MLGKYEPAYTEVITAFCLIMWTLTTNKVDNIYSLSELVSSKEHKMPI